MASNQPVDEVLARPFSETQTKDFELYVKENEAFMPLANRADASSHAKDGTPLCSACGLQDGSILYVGFRAESQGAWVYSHTDAPGLPVVQEPSLEDDLDMVDEAPPA